MKRVIAQLKERYNQFNKRERLIVTFMLIAAIVYILTWIVTEGNNYLEEKDIEIEARMEDLKNISETLKTYQSLNERFKSVKTAYSSAQMSFEKAYGNLDNMVKKNVGAAGYDLKTKGDPANIGLGYEKQDYTLKVTLTREQLVKLLFELEQGKSGLFLQLVRVSNKPGDLFDAQLDIYSIVKSKT